MANQDKYDLMEVVVDNADEARAVDRLQGIHDAYLDSPSVALARLMEERPIVFTQEEMHLAFGRPTTEDVHREVFADVTPDRLIDYDDVYTTPEEYWAARKRLDFLYRKMPALGSPEETDDHWTKRGK